MPIHDNLGMATHAVDSRHAWVRLGVALALMTIGSGAMYVVAVVLPEVQAEFGLARADASLPYTLMMVGFGLGGIGMGRIADRWGVMVVVLIGAAGLSSGFIAAGLSGGIAGFALAHGVLLGAFGSAATFAPLVADTSLWFERRRGIAVAVCASGNYAAGAIWPPVVQHFVEVAGWRHTYLGLGVFCALTMPPLALWLRARPPGVLGPRRSHPKRAEVLQRPFGFSVGVAQALLCVAAGAHRGLLRRPRVRGGARRADAVADAGLRHREQARVRGDLRPHRRAAHAGARVGAARPGTAAVHSL
jgi:MFS family permease